MDRIEKQYSFEDFRLDANNNIDVDIECGITIPINDSSEVPGDIMKLIDQLIKQTMLDYEKSYGEVKDISDLELCVSLDIGVEPKGDRHFVQVIIVNARAEAEASNALCIHPEDEYYSSFSDYCSMKLCRYLF